MTGFPTARIRPGCVLPSPASALRLAVTLAGLLALAGCASIYKAQNEKLTKVADGQGYRIAQSRKGDFGDHMIFLAFSGGGTRAAALSYGVMQELRDTQVDARGQKVRLLDEVDSISSVSGGSFTAAYYGLFGDKIFTDYEKVFLRQSIQSALIRKLFDPAYWWRSLFSGLDRTEMAIEYYDNQIFEHKTFADLRLNDGPFVEINATDLAGGTRFAFIQAYFDMLCSNLGQFSVARAVTASSAVPVAFPTVVLQNYSGDCDMSQSRLVKYLDKEGDKSPRLRELRERVAFYQDRKANPYIHLVDGGLADNLGLRAMTDRIETFGSGIFFQKGQRSPKNILVISVNAEVDPERSINQSPSKPSVVDTIDAVSDVQIGLYNDETKLLLGSKLKELEKQIRQNGHDVRIYTADVSFQGLKAKTLKSYFNNLPTSLELSGVEVDNLISAGRELLRRDPGYRDFLKANGGMRLPAAKPVPVRAVQPG